MKKELEKPAVNGIAAKLAVINILKDRMNSLNDGDSYSRIATAMITIQDLVPPVAFNPIAQLQAENQRLRELLKEVYFTKTLGAELTQKIKNALTPS